MPIFRIAGQHGKIFAGSFLLFSCDFRSSEIAFASLAKKPFRIASDLGVCDSNRFGPLSSLESGTFPWELVACESVFELWATLQFWPKPLLSHIPWWELRPRTKIFSPPPQFPADTPPGPSPHPLSWKTPPLGLSIKNRPQTPVLGGWFRGSEVNFFKTLIESLCACVVGLTPFVFLLVGGLSALRRAKES